MNMPFDDMSNDEIVAARTHVDANLYYLQFCISKDEKAVLRTKLLWEEGLFCEECKQKELTKHEELESRQCTKCAHKQFLRDKNKGK